MTHFLKTTLQERHINGSAVYFSEFTPHIYLLFNLQTKCRINFQTSVVATFPKVQMGEFQVLYALNCILGRQNYGLPDREC